jgi:transposase
MRGECGHCGMVVVPTLEEKDARRPRRERESLVDEKSRITNRMKSALARLGIRGFKAQLHKAPQRIEGLRTPEGNGLPPKITEGFRCDMALTLVREQIAAIEKARIERLEQLLHACPLMVRLFARVIVIVIETADIQVRKILPRNRRVVARYAKLTGSPDVDPPTAGTAQLSVRLAAAT